MSAAEISILVGLGIIVVNGLIVWLLIRRERLMREHKERRNNRGDHG